MITASASLKQVENCSNKVVQPRVAVRLHHRDHLALGALARGSQHRGDLDRMMAVVVDDDGAVPFAHLREAPLDAAEGGQRLADRRRP